MSSRRPAEDGADNQPEAKRAKTDGSAAAPSFDIASIRARIAATKAALEKGGPSGGGSASPSATASPSTHAKQSTPIPATTVIPSAPVGTAALPPPATMDSDIAKRLAAAKARIEAINSRAKNPYLSGSGTMPKAESKPVPVPNTNSSIALHPLLMGETQQSGQSEKNEKRKERDRYKTMAPKFSTVKANANVTATSAPSFQLVPAAPAPILNPYASAPKPNGQPQGDGAGGGGGPSSRRTRKMQFSVPGRYIKQGDVLRNEEKMEALRQRIAEASKKAGLDSEFDTLERSLKVGHRTSFFRLCQDGCTACADGLYSANHLRTLNGGTERSYPMATHMTISNLPSHGSPHPTTLSSPISSNIPSPSQLQGTNANLIVD